MPVAGCFRCTCLFLLFTGIVFAQEGTPQPRPRATIPDTFINLQILPKDMKKSDLLPIMKSFSVSLGVRCGFCHEVSEDFSHANFATDTKKAKNVARVMMRMTNDINKNYISKLNDAGKVDASKAEDAKVQCATCHRGHEQPEAWQPEESQPH